MGLVNDFVQAGGVLLGGSIMSFVAAKYWSQHNAEIRERDKIAIGHQELCQRVSSLESQISLVNQSLIPFSKAFQQMMVQKLNNAPTPQLDAEVRKIGISSKLTPEEEKEFNILVDRRIKDLGPLFAGADNSQALGLPEVVVTELLVPDVLHASEALKLKLVTVAAVIGVPPAPEKGDGEELPPPSVQYEMTGLALPPEVADTP